VDWPFSVLREYEAPSPTLAPVFPACAGSTAFGRISPPVFGDADGLWSPGAPSFAAVAGSSRPDASRPCCF